MSIVLQIMYTYIGPEMAENLQYVPALGEPVTDGSVFKIGNGITPWAFLGERPVPKHGEIPSDMSLQYTTTVHDPLCRNKHESVNTDVSAIINTIE